MRKLKLNRHFSNYFVSAFLILWSWIFHSLTLSILLYWSLTSTRVPELSRMGTLNQFWMENQILFATLGSFFCLFFFRDRLQTSLSIFKLNYRYYLNNFLRGTLFGILMVAGLILNHTYEFLGFAAQLNLNFLASYTWIFRAFLLFIFVISNEFLIRVILEEQRRGQGWTGFTLQLITWMAFYWIWFTPTLSESFTLVLLFSLFNHFWSASGFLSAFFIMTHSVFGLPFFENEFIGLFQLKALQNDDRFFENPYLQITLVILLVAFKLVPQYYSILRKRKESLSS